MEPNGLKKMNLTEDEQHGDEPSVEGHLLKLPRVTEEPAPEGLKTSRVASDEDELDVEGHIRQL